jgi:hypothetical protein
MLDVLFGWNDNGLYGDTDGVTEKLLSITVL